MSDERDIQIVASSRLTDVLNEREVDEYLKSQKFSTPYDSWAWLSAADHALSEPQKCIVVARSNTGELLGWLPLKRGSETFFGIKIPVLRLMTHPRSDRHSLQVLDHIDGMLDELIDAATTHFSGWSAILLDEMSGIQFSGTIPKGWSSDFKRATPVYVFPDAQTSPNQLIGKRGRRARKKLDKIEHEIKVWRPAQQELTALMRDIQTVEKTSWKGDQGVGILSTEAGMRFFQSVATDASNAGSLMLATVHVEGKLASYRFGFVWRDVFYDYNFAYLPDYSNLSLGRVLLDEVIVRGFEMGLRGVDGSRVGSSYENLLRERSGDSIEHRRMMYFRWSLNGLLLRGKFRVLKPIKRAVRKTLKSGR